MSYVETVLLDRRVPHTVDGDVEIGVALLKHLIAAFNGDERLALAGWYQGERAVREHGAVQGHDAVRRRRARAARADVAPAAGASVSNMGRWSCSTDRSTSSWQRRALFAGRRAAALVTYSPKVFVPLTKLCRDVCHYCTFAHPPRRGERAFMTLDEVLDVARAGAAAGCREALFTLGDKPELRYRAARDELAALGCTTTLEYLERAARRGARRDRAAPAPEPRGARRPPTTRASGPSRRRWG